MKRMLEETAASLLCCHLAGPRREDVAELEAQVYKVKIALDNADGVFKPGMPAEAGLKAAEGATD